MTIVDPPGRLQQEERERELRLQKTEAHNHHSILREALLLASDLAHQSSRKVDLHELLLRRLAKRRILDVHRESESVEGDAELRRRSGGLADDEEAAARCMSCESEGERGGSRRRRRTMRSTGAERAPETQVEELEVNVLNWQVSGSAKDLRIGIVSERESGSW